MIQMEFGENPCSLQLVTQFSANTSDNVLQNTNVSVGISPVHGGIMDIVYVLFFAAERLLSSSSSLCMHVCMLTYV